MTLLLILLIPVVLCLIMTAYACKWANELGQELEEAVYEGLTGLESEIAA